MPARTIPGYQTGWTFPSWMARRRLRSIALWGRRDGTCNRSQAAGDWLINSATDETRMVPI